LSNCQNPFNIFSANFSSSIATEVIGDPAVTGIDAYSAIISDNSDARLTASYPDTTLKINVTGGLGISLIASTNTITLSNSWEKSGNNIYFNTGNVGIGVSDPDQKLEVSGAIHISSEGLDPTTPASGDGGIIFVKADGRPYWKSYDLGEVDLTSGSAGGSGSGGWTDDGSIVRLSAGNFRAGVGTLNPDAVLEVSGAGGSPSLLFNVRNPNTSSILAVYVPDTESQARVGIGTGTPTHLLEIKPSALSTYTTIAAAAVGGIALNMGSGVANNEFAPALSWFSDDGDLDADGTEDTIAAITAQAAEDFDASNDSGTDLVFYTHEIGSDSGLTEKLRIEANGTLSASAAISASSFWANGVEITSGGGGGAVSAVANGADNRIATFSSTDALYGEAALTYDGSAFIVSGSTTRLEVTGSDNNIIFGVHSTTDANILTVSSSNQTGEAKVGFGTVTPEASVHISFPVAYETALRVDTQIPTESAAIPTFIVSGLGNVGIGIAAPTARLEVSGSDIGSLLNIRSNSNTKIFEVSGSSPTTTHVSSSVAISASSFWKDGVELTGIGSVTALNNQAENRLVTIGSTTTELDGEANLTYDGTTLKVTGSMQITGSITPGIDSQYNLGSVTNRWANLYTGDLHLKNERGDWTIVEEEDFLCVINNKTGKKFKMLLQEIED